MPGAMKYFLDLNDPEYRELEKAYTVEYDTRLAKIKKHRDYYDGIMKKPLKIEQDDLDDNVLLTQVNQVTDRVVSFLLGKGIEFDVGADDEQTKDDETVAQLWKANRGAMLHQNLAMAGAFSGHVWLRLEPPTEPNALPHIIPLDPAHCSVFWQADDMSNVLWYRLQYKLGGEGKAAGEGAGKRIDYVRASAMPQADPEAMGWYEIVYLADKQRGYEWTPLDSPRLLSWQFSPIVEWQNMPRPHGYYGADDVSRAVALNDSINFVASSYNRILKHHGHPKTIAIGVTPTDVVPSKIGGLWTINKPDAKVFNLEMQSDLSNAREFLAILLRELWHSTRMVDPQAIKDSVGSLTNFGLRVLYSDAVNMISTKRLLYEEGLVLATKRALEMAGQTPPEIISIRWPEVLPIDTAEEVKGLIEEFNAGLIDKQTYRERRGYDSELIEQRMQEEKTEETNLGSQLLAAFSKGQ